MNHSLYMERALRLAAKGKTSPNPMVGAVVVKNGQIIGEGFHPECGKPHAEVYALQQAGESARGATMYVTLEPCCHHGRTPPCTEAIIAAGIKEVVIAMVDCDPKVSKMGISRLKEAGVKTVLSVCEEKARELNAGYIKHRHTGLPLVTLKSAMTLDGKIATSSGDSKWVTGEKSRAHAHKARSLSDAIVVGAETLRKDNPRITARVGRKTSHPGRVVVSSSLDLDPGSEVFSQTGESYVFTTENADQKKTRLLEDAGVRVIKVKSYQNGVSMSDVMEHLGRMGCLYVIIEGGGKLIASAIREKVADKVTFYYAPKIIGGGGRNAVDRLDVHSMADCVNVVNMKTQKLGCDFLVTGDLKYSE